MTITVLIVSSFLLATGGVWLFRQATHNYPRLLDVPNARSSHSIPVTRGAGVAIVGVVLLQYMIAFGNGANFVYVASALIIATVSFLDDLYSLPMALRLAVHFLTAFIFVASAAGLNFHSFSAGLGTLAFVVYIVWVINAYNFMDGIDGIAGIQGVATSLGWLLLGVSNSISSQSSMAAILLGSCLGFLIFNWQPAKVFLGDAGSTFLGYTFAVLPFIQSDDLRTSTVTDFVAPTILLWLFLFDTVYTRLRQILARKRFWRAHRDHLYQKIVHSGSSHSKVAIFYGVFGLINGIALVMQAAIGYLPLAAAILIGSTLLLLWARKKEIDVS